MEVNFFSGSLSEFRFTLFFWRRCPADYWMGFFFSTEIEGAGVLVTIKTG